MQKYVISLPRRAKEYFVGIVDVLMSWLATWMAFSLRLDSFALPYGNQWYVYFMATFIALPILIRFGLYRAVFRYAGMSAMVTIVKAIALHGAILFGVLVWFALPNVPRTVGLLQPLLFMFLVGSSRA